MTLRHLQRVTADELEYAAFHAGADIERDPATDRMYARIGNVTLVAELPSEPTC